jgi:plastocyanin
MRALALGAILALASLLAADAPAAPTAARVQVVEKEFTITLSRLRVPAGAVTVEVVNFGMDSHDLVIQSSVKGAKPLVFAQLPPGGRQAKTLGLAAGRYTLWCSLPGHRAQGMVAPLRVG